ncbi:hypothetical protein GCM10010372_10820 [Streptomyces tauricus]|nr:hypothetical protein GCM10010372_10820 [Streptomyces tauricus]
MRALGRQPRGGGQTDPGAAAGDDGGLAFELSNELPHANYLHKHKYRSVLNDYRGDRNTSAPISTER